MIVSRIVISNTLVLDNAEKSYGKDREQFTNGSSGTFVRASVKSTTQ